MLITADWVLRDGSSAPLEGHGVRVVDAVIVDVATNTSLVAKYPDDEVVDGAGHVLMAGFVNAHTHLYGVLAHGIDLAKAPSGFGSFLEDFWWPQIEDALDQDMIAAATRWGCADMLRAGTTTFYDILEAPKALPDALLVQLEAATASGIRGILSFEATERISIENGRVGIAENIALIEAARADTDGLIDGAMCFHTTFTCSEDLIRTAFASAEELDVFCHAHCNEGTHEGEWCEQNKGMRTLAFYDSIGVATPRFLASQCVQLSEAEREVLSDCGIRVTHMPLANCEVGGGIAPIPELLEAGVTIGLGSDGYINDMFEVMRGAFLIHKAKTLNPGAMPAHTVLDMATIHGAEALGLDRVGRIETGWAADLQLIDAAFPTPVAAHNLVDQLVLWRNASHIHHVMVAGKWRVRDGEVLGTDVEQLRNDVHKQAQRLWKA